MSWTIKTENDYLVATETLTFTQDQATDLASSEISFIPQGTDFLILANSAGSSLSQDGDVAVYASSESGGTFALLKDNAVADCLAAAKIALYDVSVSGEAPYYKLYLDPDGAMSAESVTLKVIVKPKA